MINFSSEIDNKYAVELSLFYKYRKFKDGIDFFHFEGSLDIYEGDHNPQFRIFIGLLNFTIFEFEIYNMFHKGD